MDQLEQFINQNREELDNLSPDPGSWDRIKKKRRSVKRFTLGMGALRYAVVLTVIALAAIGVYSLLYSPASNEVAVHELPPEMAELEYFYETQVSQQQQTINRLLANDEETRKEIERELEYLNQEKEALMEEFNYDISNEDVIERLIEVYRLRLQILNRVLANIQPETNDNQKTNDASAI